MQIFFIRENFDCNFLDSIFNVVKLYDDEIIINKNLEKLKINKIKNIVQTIIKILKNNKVNTVIIENSLKKNKEFCNLLYSNNINIINGRKIYRLMAKEILEKKIKDNKLDANKVKIAISTNSTEIWIIYLIKKLLEQYKNINLITNHVDYYKRITDDIFEATGMIIIVTNNKRRAMLNSDIILNIDFSEESINKYFLKYNAILINLEENVKINKKRFNGKIINDLEIMLKENSQIKKELTKEKYRYYDLKDITQCYIVNYPEEINNIKIL